MTKAPLIAFKIAMRNVKFSTVFLLPQNLNNIIKFARSSDELNSKNSQDPEMM